ncbi:MAG: dienelactone hydrolase family protein [Bryobacteraceae bacterium]
MHAQADPAKDMVAGIDRFLDAELKRVVGAREKLPRPDAQSRERFRKIIGAVDQRVTPVEMSYNAAVGRSSLVAETPTYKVHAVRWNVFEGVDGEGLLLEPTQPPVASIMALPDAGWSPEQIAGITPGVPQAAQYARLLAERGCRVLVPVLIDRKDTWSGSTRFRFTNQPHREFVYRMAYQMGRHIIGYEVQKTLAAVDWFAASTPGVPIGVAGYGEGGLLALYSAALDPRVSATLVSGYFQPREKVFDEPIYRNIWGLLREFGDAEIAGMVAPRALIIEASGGPVVDGPPPETNTRRGAAPGALRSPQLLDVRQEYERAKRFFDKGDLRLVMDRGAEALIAALKLRPLPTITTVQMKLIRVPDTKARLRRQFNQLVEFTQKLARAAEVARQKFWSNADTSSLVKWKETASSYRDNYWNDVMGKLPDPSEPLRPETKLSGENERWTQTEVKLPVWPDVFAAGVLLLPKDMKAGEKRPVVVAQHGLEGRPEFLINPKDDVNKRIYAKFAARLADDGFVVFVPQLPYIGGTTFRQLQRKANPLKLSLYSFILGQNQRILEWLGQQPFVDAKRIGFYGLSYGGKTAIRVPPLLEGYALSICSGDFNEWIWKTTTLDFTGSYMFTHEYEIPEFDTGNTFNHAELATLMDGRPFMVERGHRDGVGIDEQVSYEYAKVRRFYHELGIGDRTMIEYFNGPHQIHGVGTYQFLHKHLNWPERPAK